MNKKTDKLQDALGYKFVNKPLLMAALIHSSYANENKGSGVSSNERLEFLGDSLLGMAVSDELFNNMPHMTEGNMTRLRSELVCENNLAKIAEKLGIGECLMLGCGEEKSGGRSRQSILADTVEAVLAAVYLDGGFEPVAKLVSEHIISQVMLCPQSSTDYKTALQEAVQVKPSQALEYRIVEESGPDHQKVFSVAVLLNGTIIGTGTGKTKKAAEQAAAKSALNEPVTIERGLS